jgi:hypothetical protein
MDAAPTLYWAAEVTRLLILREARLLCSNNIVDVVLFDTSAKSPPFYLGESKVNREKEMKFDTICLLGGHKPDSDTHSRAVPIHQTTSYLFENSEHAARLFALEEPGYIYTRMMNPTTEVLEKRIAMLEGGVGALAFASGMGAIAAGHFSEKVTTSLHPAASMAALTRSSARHSPTKWELTSHSRTPMIPPNLRMLHGKTPGCFTQRHLGIHV